MIAELSMLLNSLFIFQIARDSGVIIIRSISIIVKNELSM